MNKVLMSFLTINLIMLCGPASGQSSRLSDADVNAIYMQSIVDFGYKSESQDLAIVTDSRRLIRYWRRVNRRTLRHLIGTSTS